MIVIEEQEFRQFADYIKAQYGIHFKAEKKALIEGRLGQVLLSMKFDSLTEYMNYVMSDKTGQAASVMLDRITTNHTYFMREPAHFHYFRNKVLPFLTKAVTDRDLRIWSAGCSTGQEPYNIAMVIDEYFGGQKSGWDTTILATDISMKALSAAQQGIYTDADLKDVSPGGRTKYFRPLGEGRFQVADTIRKEVIFRPFNLMDPFAFRRPFDLIFCRNVMIYFDAGTKAKLVRKFYDHTQDGGFLFIGHSESISSQQSPYTYIQPAIYQRRG